MEKNLEKKFMTHSGIPVEEVYGPPTLAKVDYQYEKDLGAPGAYPYTRGLTFRACIGTTPGSWLNIRASDRQRTQIEDSLKQVLIISSR